MIPFSDEELRPAVEKSLEKIKPMIEMDGGGMTLLDIKNGKVFVQLGGACVGCGSSEQTVKFGMERQLRLDIHPELEVFNIAPGMEYMIDEMAKQGQ